MQILRGATKAILMGGATPMTLSRMMPPPTSFPTTYLTVSNISISLQLQHRLVNEVGLKSAHLPSFIESNWTHIWLKPPLSTSLPDCGINTTANIIFGSLCKLDEHPCALQHLIPDLVVYLCVCQTTVPPLLGGTIFRYCKKTRDGIVSKKVWCR